MSALLEVEGLRVHFHTDDGVVKAVDGASFAVEPGRVLGIVGESGSGKTVASLAVMGLLRTETARVEGRVGLDGQDLLTVGDEEMRRLRGRDVAMVFQDPLSSLHPYYRIGRQLVEAIRAHDEVSRSAARERAIELLGLVGIPQPRRRVDSYPHELSGGMRQRVMIAMALANRPRLLIADEPTTALDVTVQAQILELLARLREELGMAMVIVTHDLGVVAATADDVAVMYAGRIVERGPARTVFTAPEHPYTWGLLGSTPRLDSPPRARLRPIAGRPPSLIDPPRGCSFHPRCPYARERHRHVEPALEPAGGGPGHLVACLLSGEERRALWRDLQRSGAPASAARTAPVAEEVT